MIALQFDSLNGEGDHQAPQAVDQITGLSRLLHAVATVLNETLDRFEAASGEVTQTVLTGGTPADHELIVALQNFDRIYQEFSAIKSMISHCATASEQGSGPSDDWKHEAIAGITLTDVRQRLLNCLAESLPPGMAEPVDDEVVF
jgi:hypothetical protein